MPPAPILEWHSKARADLLELITYIAADNPDAAQALKEEIEAKTGALPKHPRLYRPGRVKGTREMVVRPNYLVVYREQPGMIIVLRVLHAARQWPPARDIEAGSNVRDLPEDLARAMLEQAGHAVNLEDEIEGDVDL